MSETLGQSKPTLNYQQAQAISTHGTGTVQTNLGVHRSGTIAVNPTGQTVHMRIIPKAPRQNGEEARTD
jgi:predicted TIM-barrel enzyme